MSVTAVQPSVSRRSYVSIVVFNEFIYNYSYGLDEALLREVGTLTLNSAATPANCPAGRVLHENGRKLNPRDVFFPGSNPPVATYMVGVYDPVTFVSGFINPNAPVFSVFSTDVPTYLSQPGSDNSTGAPNLANGLYAGGSVVSITHDNDYQEMFLGSDNVNYEKYAGAFYYGGNDITIEVGNNDNGHNVVLDGSNGDVSASGDLTVSGYADVSGNITCRNGDLAVNNGLLGLNSRIVGVADMDGGVNVGGAGGPRKLTVSSTGCRLNSKIFLTYASLENPGFLSVEEVGTVGVSSFRIVSSNQADRGTIHYLITN